MADTTGLNGPTSSGTRTRSIRECQVREREGMDKGEVEIIPALSNSGTKCTSGIINNLVVLGTLQGIMGLKRSLTRILLYF